MEWLRYWKSREERLMEKVSPAHRFFHGAAGPGRAAYLVLCLERALRALDQSPADWRWVLDRLWTLAARIPVAFGEYGPLYEVYSLLPAHVLPFARFEEIVVLPLGDGPAEQWEPENGRTYLTEERFAALWELYLQAGWRMAVFAPLLALAWEEALMLSTDAVPPWPKGLEPLFEAETLLTRWGIPLPRVEEPEAVQALLRGEKRRGVSLIKQCKR